MRCIPTNRAILVEKEEILKEFLSPQFGNSVVITGNESDKKGCGRSYLNSWASYGKARTEGFKGFYCWNS
ncbi:hypothetical protein TELCIR_01317 [Teladorsagia circumcincta]|uniref:Uncharacterized protein n=1 Tax=Teladorsagia circumcincta TaxID=45464 RepID=A0A2G9V296_TELCI|nr:hypothetical protein TELCIR_01317 [Teladorsagia circumcincta]